jgi:opacity protein-like surface antigen
MRFFLLVLTTAALIAPAAPAAAQTQAPASNVPERRWSFDFGLGWDNNLGGNINSGGIGVLQNQAVVILPNSYGDVYGTGLHVRFGGGYKLDNLSEVRAVVTYQSLSSDLTFLGDIGIANLYASYDNYRSLTLDVGYRRYVPNTVEGIRVYAEGTVGLGFISELDTQLAAPATNIVFDATDFYDATAAFALGANAGVLFTVASQMDIYGQIGLRYMTGLSEVDDLVGTGLETINDGSRRWTLPIVIGVNFRF